MELWDALDTRLCEALVRKGVDERGLTTNTRLTPDKLLAVLREKLARADAGGTNARPLPPAAVRPSALAALHAVQKQPGPGI